MVGIFSKQLYLQFIGYPIFGYLHTQNMVNEIRGHCQQIFCSFGKRKIDMKNASPPPISTLSFPLRNVIQRRDSNEHEKIQIKIDDYGNRTN